MADFDGVIVPTATLTDVPQLSRAAIAIGGAGGAMNAQAVALANRIEYLAGDAGASRVKFKRFLAAAKVHSVQQYIFGTVPSLFDFMSDDEIEAVQTNTWAKVSNVSAALDAAAAVCTGMIAPPGIYRQIRPWILKLPKQTVYGSGAGVTEFQVAPGFAGVEWGGQTRTAMIWHQPPGAFDGTEGWIIGGAIRDLTLNCALQCDGIILNRVNQSQIVLNVHIYRPINGIDNYYGWCHTYQNVYIQGAQIFSIKLGSGANGTNINGCFLIGWNFANDRTQIHIDVASASSGNSVTGGAIELCDAAIRTTGRGQIAVSGADFEEVAYRYAQHFGTYVNGVLTEAGAASTYTGCNFVGAPSGGGLVSSGASIISRGNQFQNYDALPTGVDQYALYGIAAGQNLTGLPGAGVSDIGSTFFGWGDQVTGHIKKGGVRTIVIGELAAEDVSVPKKIWTPVLNGVTTSGTVTIQDAVCVKMGRLVTFNMQIQATTIQTTALTSYITGLPFAPSIAGACSAISGSVANPSSALVFANGRIYLPTNAAWGNSLIVSGSYFTDA